MTEKEWQCRFCCHDDGVEACETLACVHRYHPSCLQGEMLRTGIDSKDDYNCPDCRTSGSCCMEHQSFLVPQPDLSQDELPGPSQLWGRDLSPTRDFVVEGADGHGYLQPVETPVRLSTPSPETEGMVADGVVQPAVSYTHLTLPTKA